MKGLRHLLLAAALAGVPAFYLPGVAPKEYLENEKVEVKVNKLSSSVTQLPYDYYNLAFCKPKDLRNSVENLGEVLHGSMIQNSPYELFMQKSDFKVLCKVDLTKKQVENFGKRIKNDYRVQMIMDNLPAATRMISELPDGKTVTMYDRGYRCAPPPTCASHGGPRARSARTLVLSVSSYKRHEGATQSSPYAVTRAPARRCALPGRDRCY